LGTPISSSNQTVLSTEIPAYGARSSIIMEAATPSVEFSLMCERQRATVVSGVTDYVVDKDGSTLMLTTGEQVFRYSSPRLHLICFIHFPFLAFVQLKILFSVPTSFVRAFEYAQLPSMLPPEVRTSLKRYKNNTLSPLAVGSCSNGTTTSGDFVFDTQFCPSDSKLVSYVLNKQVHIERDGSLLYKTVSTDPNVSNGVSPFIAQEELDRFQAVWWSPTTTRLLYEKVDESKVRSLTFVCPGREAPPPMKYPVAGTDNAASELRLVVVDGNTVERVVTHGDFSVCKSTSVVVDRDRLLVYYIANVHHPTEWSVCVSSYDENDRSMRQLTEGGLLIDMFRGERACHHLCLLPSVGFACWMTSLSQPPHCRYYALSFSDKSIGLPGYALPPTVQINDMPLIVEYQSRLVRFAMVMRPSNCEADRSYPVLHYVYGGPGIQLVRNDYCTWIPFQKYTKLGFAVVMLDGRGSSNRGTDFDIVRLPGQCEVEDQVEGLKEVAQLLDGMLDLSRVVVQGWSYGGYMSLLALAKFPNVFRAAIAGGAVTDWKLYDTAYTERYLGYGADRDPFYDESSVIKHVEKLPDQPGRLLLVHGLLDENVHFRHTEALIEQLIKAGKPYQLQLFPSERHGIRSSDGAAHLDASMLNFIQQALKD
uniref:Dipeptidyl-peptidase IV n=1 Tax=Heligmosomoides polygyrus TaxID=6339 RepID=A0A8L8Q1P0_HELPZ